MCQPSRRVSTAWLGFGCETDNNYTHMDNLLFVQMGFFSHNSVNRFTRRKLFVLFSFWNLMNDAHTHTFVRRSCENWSAKLWHQHNLNRFSSTTYSPVRKVGSPAKNTPIEIFLPKHAANTRVNICLVSRIQPIASHSQYVAHRVHNARHNNHVNFVEPNIKSDTHYCYHSPMHIAHCSPLSPSPSLSINFA